MKLLTHSRIACASECLRKHFWRYELALQPVRTAQPLRMGAAYHYGLELADTMPIEDAVMAAVADYDAGCPDYMDEDKWATERETVASMVAGHDWRWRDHQWPEVMATEGEFCLPLINPASGTPSRTWQLAGKRDRVVRMSDGRVAIVEYKTTSEALDIDSDLWGRLQMDRQISIYWLAALQEGIEVDTVIYDVCRKPTIRLRKNETPTEYGERLRADMADRPDFYFRRQEVPRLQADLDECQGELWAWGKILRSCELDGHWPRNTAACQRFGRCEYWDLCTSGFDGGHVPEGFVCERHPELSVDTD